MNGCVILHQTPTRLRVRLSALAESECNPAWLESWLEAQPGVKEVRINRKVASVVVTFDPQRTDGAAVIGRLASYPPQQAPQSGAAATVVAEIAPMVTSAAALAAMPFLSRAQRRLLTLANVTPVLIEGADVLVRQGIKMEVLDALAVGLATLKGKAYTANITAFLLALGKFLEHQTEHQTERQSDRLLRRLLRPDPAPAWVEREGELIQVSGATVKVGEIVVVGVGEAVPVDGRVIEGVALVNQAAVTGEDLPVRREQRQRVIAGSVVEEGRIRIEAQRVGSDTTTARVASFNVVAVGSGHLSEDALLALVASVEEHASHPLAQAVVLAARERDLNHITHGEVDYLVAHGLSTDVDGKRVIIGSRHFLEEHHGVSFAEHEAVICRLQEEGKTLLYVGRAGQDRAQGGPIGVVALRDTLRADAADALQRLRALGIKQLITITGDRRAKAEALAADLGLDELSQHELLAALDATGCLYVAADVQAVPTARTSTPGEGVADAFGKALVGVLAQRTVTRIIGALL